MIAEVALALLTALASGASSGGVRAAPSACADSTPTFGPDGAEQCDDGNDENGDGCDRTCTPTACGNGVRTSGERCDDGNDIDGDGCDAGCTATACGNGILSASELCDDGNVIDGDGCDRTCTPTACGNGVRTSGERCDDGNGVDNDGCSSTCTPPLAQLLARGSALVGTVLLTSGAALAVGGGLFRVGQASAWTQVREAGRTSDGTLRARAMAADRHWHDVGIPLVLAGGASLFLGGGLLALGLAPQAEDDATATPPGLINDEERVP